MYHGPALARVSQVQLPNWDCRLRAHRRAHLNLHSELPKSSGRFRWQMDVHCQQAEQVQGDF